MKCKNIFSALILAGAAAWPLAPAAAYNDDATACPFAERTKGRIAVIGPLRINYCEGFGHNTNARDFLVENRDLYISKVASIKTELERRTGKFARIVHVYTQTNHKNLENFIDLAGGGWTGDITPSKETLQDPDTGTSIVKLSHRPKDNTDYFYFPQDRPLADADTVVMCAPLSTKPLLPTSAFKSRDAGDPVYHHCFFRIRYKGPVMIDADFWDIQWNEVADVRHALIDLVDRLVVK